LSSKVPKVKAKRRFVHSSCSGLNSRRGPSTARADAGEREEKASARFSRDDSSALVADALTHVGQLAMLRRVAGAPIRAENYAVAEIVAGRTGADQVAARWEFE
jgi:hypothetical protein